MKSFSILRTNVGLTTNIKVMVDSLYGLYLESIDSTPSLADSKYKKVQFSKDSIFTKSLQSFFSGGGSNGLGPHSSTPINTAFAVKYDNDNDNMSTNFDNQYDDIYQMGCRNISDNKNYTEEFECFAPLYLFKSSIPKYFIVFRVDGPGLENVNSENFVSEILNNLKCVKVFDLTTNTPVGEWIDKNFTRNISYPSVPFEIDFRKLEFSTWNGIDYTSGVYTQKSFMLDSTLEYENTFYDFEKMVYDGYKNNKIVYPNILNISFLFDDTPATQTSLRNWSINRYMGFYMNDIDLIVSVSPYVPPKLRSDVIIGSDNTLYSTSFGNPFDQTATKYSYLYVEINGNFYKAEKYIDTLLPELQKIQISKNVYEDIFTNQESIRYKIISDLDLSGRQSELNKNIITINSNNQIVYLDGTAYTINNFSYSDVWIIKIGDIYHNLEMINGILTIRTDYGFNVFIDHVEYYINSPDKNYNSKISLIVNDINPPKSFPIFRCNFSDIKDFDTKIVDTEFSKFEYMVSDGLTPTDETKMYTINHDSTSNPKDYNDFKLNGSVSYIPSSSEYTANGETFRVIEKSVGGETLHDLSPLWRKNSERVKWGYQNSNEYPYLLNNSFSAEDFNRSVNVFTPVPHRHDRNLDYFYSINSSSGSYSYHSLHIEDSTNGVINGSFSFNLDKYLNNGTYSYNYFDYFFGKKAFFDSGKTSKNIKKWSYMNVGDNIIPNSTLFKGIKYKIYDVDSLKSTNGVIDRINIKSLNTYDDYKFSILLSKNNLSLSSIPGIINSSTYSQFTNGLSWSMIDTWKHDKAYSYNDIVSYDSTLYQCINASGSTITDPNILIYKSGDWGYFTSSIFWSPLKAYSSNDIVYNYGEYYLYNTGSYGFWIPGNTYSTNDVVLYNNQTWISSTSSNLLNPSIDKYWTYSDGLNTLIYNRYWTLTNSNTPNWLVVNLWNHSKIYETNDYVVYDDTLYKCTSTNYNTQPDLSINNWKRIYSMSPDTNFLYSTYGTMSAYMEKIISNNILYTNNRYYLCTGNSNSSTLDSGINIYINKKYKNILINIYVNDNTLPNISNTNRDNLYNDLYSNLTAFNFMNAINDISNKYGFSDSLKYIIINEDSSVNIYDSGDINSIINLPCFFKCDYPDQFLSRISSFNILPHTLTPSQIKPKRPLGGGNISSIGQLNYFNNISLSTKILKINDDDNIVANYHGLKNQIYNVLYRHSGYYMPIFYDIQLFMSPVEYPGITSSGNYKFDTSLTDFGIMKERVVSKVNRSSNILKLKNNVNINSIYPMLDEFGYTTVDSFIFKSSWDYEYYVECVDIPQIATSISSNDALLNTNQNNTQQL